MKIRGRQESKPMLMACALVLAALQLGGCAGAPSRGADAAHGDAQALGIEMLGVRRSAAGYMLDVRYKVVDPDKAAPLVDRKVQPYLLDQATGARLFVPSSAKVGPLRQTGREAVPGQVYFALFANPARYVEAGSKVTLVIGDQKVRDLTVLE